MAHEHVANFLIPVTANTHSKIKVYKNINENIIKRNESRNDAFDTFICMCSDVGQTRKQLPLIRFNLRFILLVLM